MWFERKSLCLPMVWKVSLNPPRYVSVTLRNPPRSLPLQKHLLTPKQNIMRIKTPKTQTLFERETRGAVRLFVVVWSVWRERKHLFCIIKARQGMCDCCICVLDVNFLSRPTLLGFAVYYMPIRTNTIEINFDLGNINSSN